MGVFLLHAGQAAAGLTLTAASHVCPLAPSSSSLLLSSLELSDTQVYEP